MWKGEETRVERKWEKNQQKKKKKKEWTNHVQGRGRRKSIGQKWEERKELYKNVRKDKNNHVKRRGNGMKKQWEEDESREKDWN